jgi:hypothetical protein
LDYKIKVLSVCDLASKRFKFFDLHENYGVVGVVEDGGSQRLYANGLLWAEWEASRFPYIYRVKWIDQARVLLWLTPSGSIIASSQSVNEAAIGFPSGVMVSDDVMFVMYGDEAVMSAKRDAYEFNVVSAFSKDGRFTCGFADLAHQTPHEGSILVVGHYYARHGRLTCLAYDTEYVWTFDPKERSLQRILLGPILYANVTAFFGDEKACWLIVEGSEGLSAIALDLKSGQKMHEIADVADIISRNGFDPARLSFADGYEGKMVISDGRMAGIFEMSA